MGPEKRDGASGALVRPGRIPVPPTATPDTKNASASTKSGIPSPRRRAIGSGLSRLKDNAVAASPTTTTSSMAKRPTQAATSKITKPVARSLLNDDKDDVRQRDSGTKDSGIKKDSAIQRDKAPRDSVLRKPVSFSEAGNQPDAGKRLLKQPSLLLKSSVTSSIIAAHPTTSTSSSKPAAAVPQATSTSGGGAAAKQAPRSVSTTRDRLSSDTRTSMMRRSMSVGKGRALMTPVPDHFPLQSGAKFRPIAERPASAAGAPSRPMVDKREASVGRARPVSAGGKIESSLPSTSSKFFLAPIAEAPARPAASPAPASAAAPGLAKLTPSKPAFSLNLAALKQQQQSPAPAPTAPAPSVSPAPSATKLRPRAEPAEPAASDSTEDAGPPVPKLDLGGILQRRAEEQALEPVFMVAASNEDAGQVSATGSQQGLVDKRRSGSRQPSAKEEPAEHFYLYPKVQPQEKKRIEDICRVVPRKQQAAITELFSKMVEARQNCEQMCFRGHRLLDQAQAEFRNRLAQKEEEVAQTKEEAAQWRQEAEYLRSQLALLLGPRQPEEGAADGEGQKEPQMAAAEALLRSSLMATFDSMARLRGAAARSFGGGEAPTESYSGDLPTEGYSGGGADGEYPGEAQPEPEAGKVETGEECASAAHMDEMQVEPQRVEEDSDGEQWGEEEQE